MKKQETNTEHRIAHLPSFMFFFLLSLV